MPRDKGIVFREVPPATHTRALHLAAEGVGGPRAEGADVLRLASEVGLLALEAVVSGTAAKGVVRLCREAGAHLRAELGEIPEDAPEAVRGVAAELLREGVPAGLLAPPKGSADSAEVRYAEAYTLGIQEGEPGATWTLSAADSRAIGSTLGPALRAHAIERGIAIRGDALITWIRRTVAEFRRTTAHEGQYWSGWTPRAFARWLNQRSSASRSTAQPAARRPFGKEAR